MYKVNDLIVHRREGLSTIVSMRNSNDKEFYVVCSKRDKDETIYIPVDTADLVIRPILTSVEADDVLMFMKGLNKEFNTNTKQRRDAYKRRLASGEVNDIAYLYRQLYFYNAIGAENNTEIKLGAVDLEMLNYAKDMILDEFAISYGVDRDAIEEFVENRISKL